MSSNHRGSASSSRQRGRNVSNETRTRVSFSSKYFINFIYAKIIAKTYIL